MAVRYDGRVLVCTLVINTERDPVPLLTELAKVARGPGKPDGVVTQLEGYSGDTGRELWANVARVAANAQAKNRVVADAGDTSGAACVDDPRGDGSDSDIGIRSVNPNDKPSIQDAVSEIDVVVSSLIDRGISPSNIASIMLGVGTKTLRTAGAERAQAMKVIGMVWDGEVDTIIADEAFPAGAVVKFKGDT